MLNRGEGVGWGGVEEPETLVEGKQLLRNKSCANSSCFPWTTCQPFSVFLLEHTSYALSAGKGLSEFNIPRLKYLLCSLHTT